MHVHLYNRCVPMSMYGVWIPYIKQGCNLQPCSTQPWNQSIMVRTLIHYMACQRLGDLQSAT